MSNSVLVVAAHPDDEVLGCGGTIARHARNGDHVQVLIVAEGATSSICSDRLRLMRSSQPLLDQRKRLDRFLEQLVSNARLS